MAKDMIWRSERLSGIGMTSQRTRTRLVNLLRGEGISNERVLEVIESVPRHIFLDEALASRAYENVALPIGFGQTISQPYIVAKMTEVLLAAGPCQRVLEIGTGSGYQTAVLASLVGEVFTVERIAALLNRAMICLGELGLANIQFHHSDGILGWQEHAPYDGIIVTAAGTQVPDSLLRQLADKGRMVLPVGVDDFQQLRLISREGDQFNEEVLDAVRFVPLLEGKQ